MGNRNTRAEHLSFLSKANRQKESIIITQERMAKLKGWSMERQHLGVIYNLNNAAWSDSHQAAHEPRKDRNIMKEDNPYPAK